MGNPIGNEKYYRPAWEAFLKNLSDWNLQALFYEADERVTLMLHDYGFDFMKFGENAMVDLTTFSVDGKHGKKFRKPTNRVEKAGFQFKLLNPPFSETQMQEMKAVSDIWLNGRKEKGFSFFTLNDSNVTKKNSLQFGLQNTLSIQKEPGFCLI